MGYRRKHRKTGRKKMSMREVEKENDECEREEGEEEREKGRDAEGYWLGWREPSQLFNPIKFYVSSRACSSHYRTFCLPPSMIIMMMMMVMALPELLIHVTVMGMV